MSKNLTIVILAVAILAGAIWIYLDSAKPDKRDLIRVDNIKSGQEIGSSFEVKGEARGNWFFEASFPIEVTDGKGNKVGGGIAETQGEWMTENFVPFKAEVTIHSEPETKNGFLILKKDNPSGLAEHDDSLIIPITFASGAGRTDSDDGIKVKVYFGNSKLDPQALDCKKVFAVERKIPKTQAVGRAALEELLKSPSADEKTKGYFTSINSGVKIQKLTIQEGLASVDFNEILEKDMGGSCRVMAIRAQIEETLKQFPTVVEVKISVNGRTEDILQP